MIGSRTSNNSVTLPSNKKGNIPSKPPLSSVETDGIDSLPPVRFRPGQEFPPGKIGVSVRVRYGGVRTRLTFARCELFFVRFERHRFQSSEQRLGISDELVVNFLTIAHSLHARCAARSKNFASHSHFPSMSIDLSLSCIRLLPSHLPTYG